LPADHVEIEFGMILEQMATNFRSAIANDAPNILDLVHASYRGDSSRMGWTHEADLLGGQRVDLDGILEIVETNGSRILLAEVDSQLVGCCQLEERPGSSPSMYLGMFSVRPDMQGNGLGRLIVQEAERIASEEVRASEIRMSVIRQRIELIAWYERLGYSSNGETLPFPYGDERFGIPKRDDLEFVVLTKSLDTP
jgi:ribosomal protein S18 acetylase RimI-like enzyme